MNDQKNVLVLQHAAPENLGTIADALNTAGIRPTYARTFDGAPVPKNPDSFDALILMGGPQSVYETDRFPYLKEELRLIEQTLKANKPILGVCLGSQLLAAALGAPVTPGTKKEIGWFPITLKQPARTDPLFKEAPPSFIPLHWHGDIFQLPEGAISLASSTLTEHQAFRYGANAYGLLFHMEITPPMINEWTTAFAGELQKEGLNGQDILRKTAYHQPPLHTLGSAIYSNWTALLTSKQHPLRLQQ